MYQSPMVDNGYDISDYYAIDPMFGSMDEMKQLIKEAKKRNMYILLDLVVNHCSSEHEWFQKAMADPEGGIWIIFLYQRRERWAATDQLEILFWRQCLGEDPRV